MDDDRGFAVPPVAPPTPVDAKHGRDLSRAPHASSLGLVWRGDLDRNDALVDVADDHAGLAAQLAKERATIAARNPAVAGAFWEGFSCPPESFVGAGHAPIEALRSE
jgi:hypothetical protein